MLVFDIETVPERAGLPSLRSTLSGTGDAALWMEILAKRAAAAAPHCGDDIASRQ